MDIILVNPFPKYALGINEATIEQPVGLGYLAAVLEKNGFTCKIIDANVLRLKNEDVQKLIEFYNPKVIGISTNIVTSQAGIELSRKLKETNKDCFIIFGGPHPSSLPEKILNDASSDAIVIGEGEITLLEIMENLRQKRNPFANVNGIVYKENRQIIINNPRKLIENLDILPFPAYHLLPHFNHYNLRARKQPVAPLLTSRGCPFQCIYCNSSIFGKIYRKRSVSNIIEEIEYLIKNYNIRQLDILDDNFSLDLERTKNFFDVLIEKKYNLAINIQNGLRVDAVDEELLDKMKMAGVFKISLGVESGDEAILKRIKKKIKLEDVLKVTRWAKERGIIVYGNFMLGLLGDTEESMKRTITFAKKMNPHVANFMITYPIVGTELYHQIEKEGTFLINPTEGTAYGFYGGKVFYEIGETKKGIVLYYYKKAYRDFYCRSKQIIQIFLTIRSISELKWTFNAIINVIKGLGRKS